MARPGGIVVAVHSATGVPVTRRPSAARRSGSPSHRGFRLRLVDWKRRRGIHQVAECRLAAVSDRKCGRLRPCPILGIRADTWGWGPGLTTPCPAKISRVKKPRVNAASCLCHHETCDHGSQHGWESLTSSSGKHPMVFRTRKADGWKRSSRVPATQPDLSAPHSYVPHAAGFGAFHGGMTRA